MKNNNINEDKWIDEIWDKVNSKLSKVAIRSREKIPYSSQNGVHDDYSTPDKIDWWTNGFWGGMMWLMYDATGNADYRTTAEVSEKKLDAMFENYDKLHHDVGFMWHILSGANYKLTGNPQSRARNLLAASVLASRYNISGKFIRAWNDKGAEGWSIIDCLMNIPLLYWASEEIGDDRFKKIAISHADMAMRDHIREDGSVNHIVEHHTETGEALKIHGGQGYSENSCWSRGLAWAIYGMVLSYKYTQKHEYLDAAVKTANYFITNIISTDYRAVVDFRAPNDPLYFDSTAGLCAACGMLEIAKNVSDAESTAYIEAAKNIIKATDKYFCDYNEGTDSIVLMGTERYPHESMKGVHIPIIYGDFFFVEALCKLKNLKFLIW